MSHRTEALVYSSFVSFVVANMCEYIIFELGHSAMKDAHVSMTDAQFQDASPEEYVQFVVKHTQFADFAKDAIEMNCLEEGKGVIYAANHGKVVVYNLPA